MKFADKVALYLSKVLDTKIEWTDNKDDGRLFLDGVSVKIDYIFDYVYKQKTKEAFFHKYGGKLFYSDEWIDIHVNYKKIVFPKDELEFELAFAVLGE